MRYLFVILIFIFNFLSLTNLEAGINKIKSSSEPILLQADDITLSPDEEIVTATGHVEVIQEKEVLTAHQLIYNRKTGILIAKGNVILQRPNGDVIFSPFIELHDQMKEGVIKEMRVLFPDDARLAANKGIREGGNKVQLDQAVYSPCKVCKEQPNKPPLWQIKAQSVLWDEEKHDIIYTDARMEFMGVPVFYTPYFRHPDPNVKQRSGLLTPKFTGSDDLGAVFIVPYYYVMSPDKDITITPIITTKRGAFLDGEYRQRFSNAYLVLRGSYGQSKKLENKTTGNLSREERVTKWRGHTDSVLNWDVTPHWRVRGNILRATDKTYLRQFPFYGHRTENVLTSRGVAEGFYGLDYVRAQGLFYQGLRDTDQQKTIPVIGPLVDYNYVSNPQIWGSRFYSDTSALVVTREEGTDVQRFSTTLTWSLPYTSPWGDRYALSLKARGDLYHMTDFIPQGKTQPIDQTRGRFFPQFYLDYDYPWYKSFENGSLIISPVASLVIAPKVEDQGDFPNEDCFILEPTDMNIMLPSRFPGLDRIDGGSRFNYGLKADARFYKNFRVDAFIAQSADFSHPSAIFNNTGFDKKWSDYVGRIGIHFSNYFDARYRFRIDRSNLRAIRNEVLASFGVPALRFTVDYLKLPRTRDEVQSQGGEQISLEVSSNFAQGWTATAATIREIGKGNYPLAHSVSLAYENECLAGLLRVGKNYFRDRDVVPSTNFLFILSFKTAGGLELAKIRAHKEFGGDTTGDSKIFRRPF